MKILKLTKIVFFLFLIMLSLSLSCGTGKNDNTEKNPTYPKINLKVGSVNIISGGNYDFGTTLIDSTSVASFTIENSANNVLHITENIIINGVDQNQFIITQPDAFILPLGTNKTFTISFAPTSLSEKTANVIIKNDDPNETTYNFTIKGTGAKYPPNTKLGSLKGNAYLKGQEDHKGIQIKIAELSFTTTAVDGSYSFNNIPEGRYILSASKNNYKTETQYNVDILEVAYYKVPAITLEPSETKISINNDSSKSKSTLVYLTLTAEKVGSGVTEMMISNDSLFTNTIWGNFISPKSWTIASGDENKTIYVKFKDAFGIESEAVSDDIILDTKEPYENSISINEGDYTISTSINLTINSQDAFFMAISEDSTLLNSWIPYAGQYAFNLSSGDGLKYIYIKFKDNAENKSNISYNSIILDPTPPARPEILTQDQTVDADKIILILSQPSTDTNFNLYQLKGGQYNDWTDVSEINNFNFNLNQNKENELIVRGKDKAGNTGESTSIKIIEDSTPPVTTAVPKEGMYNSTAVHVTLSTNEFATIYYSLDTTALIQDYIAYTSPITINSPTKLKFYAINNAGGKESVKTKKYEFIRIVGSIDTPGNANGAYVSGNYAYVADYDAGLKIIDISNPTSPAIVGSIDTPGYANGVYISGNYAYVADYDAGLKIIDISNPTSPAIVGSIDTPGYANGVYISGNYAYVADEYLGLQIIDISTPTNPSIAGNANTPGSAYGVSIIGNYAYIADYSSGLTVIDISNPTNPSIIGSKYSPYRTYGVYAIGNYAYIANGESGLTVIDVSNPINMSIVGNFYTKDSTASRGVYVTGNYAYIADGSAGLRIIDITNPSNPSIIETVNTPGYAIGVYVSGNYIYIADLSSGLQIIQLLTIQ